MTVHNSEPTVAGGAITSAAGPFCPVSSPAGSQGPGTVNTAGRGFPLTRRQADMLRYLVGHRETGNIVQPTFAAMGAALGISQKSSVSRLIDALVERGWLRRHGRYCGLWLEILAPIPIPRAPDGAPLYFIPADRLLAHEAHNG